jgi:hypothetical protein
MAIETISDQPIALGGFLQAREQIMKVGRTQQLA